LLAAALNYWLCIHVLFRHRATCRLGARSGVYSVLAAVVGGIDLLATMALLGVGLRPWAAKATAPGITLVLNYCGRRWSVFPEGRLSP
jgi:dolichol-phosphate mannosyltransferase